jgi:hypothetical protein
LFSTSTVFYAAPFKTIEDALKEGEKAMRGTKDLKCLTNDGGKLWKG